jgi:hypothetical protein
VNNKGKEEIMTHVKVRYGHLTDHRHPSPDMLQFSSPEDSDSVLRDS